MPDADTTGDQPTYNEAAFVTDVRAMLAAKGVDLANIDDQRYRRVIYAARLLLSTMKITPTRPQLRLVSASGPLPNRATTPHQTFAKPTLAVARPAP